MSYQPNVHEFDDGDFIESLIKHLAMCPTVMDKARSLGLSGDDFVVDEFSGIKIYREFVNSIMIIGQAPVSPPLLARELKNRVNEGKLNLQQMDLINKLYGFIFDGSVLNSEYIKEKLHDFILYKRAQKLKLLYGDDLGKLTTEYGSMTTGLKAKQEGSELSFVSPFKAIVKNPYPGGIKTGLKLLDHIVYGVGYGEFAMLVGFSGGGKTTFLIQFLLYPAISEDKKTLLISLEEPASGISNRIYANIFGLSYSDLRISKESTMIELENEMQKMAVENPSVLNKLQSNIRVADFRASQGMTTADLAREVDKFCAMEDFYPDLVIVDQLDYIEPMKPSQAGWENYENAVFELDAWSHTKICGKKAFGLWLAHQATNGKIKEELDRGDISGYKGVVKPCDFAFGIGRKSEGSPEVVFNSLKTRGTGSVNNLRYRVDFEKMRILGQVKQVKT